MMRDQRLKDSKEAYVEVLEILKYMEPEYVEKLPIKLREFLEKNASKDYKFELDKTIPFEEQKLKESTIDILALINYNYWCEDEEHKKYLLKKYNENEIKYQEMLMEKYSMDKIFEREYKSTSTKKSNVPQKYEESKWYTGILNFIKKLFNIE